MAGIYVTDITHYLDDAGAAVEVVVVVLDEVDLSFVRHEN